MRKLFDEMRLRIESFTEQRETLALVASLGLREHIALCKVLQSMDEGASRHIFWVFPEPFVNATAYAIAVVTNARARFLAMSESLDTETAARFPTFPEELLQPGSPPEQRIRELLVFARSLIANLDQQHLVAAFVPQQIDDGEAYAQLFQAVLAHNLPIPWCHHMRIIVRNDHAEGGLAKKLSGRYMQFYRPDLSDAALEQALENEINDAREPIGQRMQSLMVLAGMDSSHRRTAQALEKYELLANYHLELGNLPALALALNGMGEACAIADRTDEARTHFERALQPSIDAKDLPTLSNITFNLARLHQQKQEWHVASEYYAGLSSLAKAALNVPLLLISHEEGGTCLRMQRQSDAALEQWRAGATLSKGAGMADQQLKFLRRSAELLKSNGRTAELRDVEKQIAELRQARVQDLPL